MLLRGSSWSLLARRRSILGAWGQGAGPEHGAREAKQIQIPNLSTARPNNPRTPPTATTHHPPLAATPVICHHHHHEP